MSNISSTLFLILGILAAYSIQHINAQNPCTCTLLKCTCCQGITIPALGLDKKICITYKLNILPIKVDVTIKQDENVIAEFSIDPKNPPEYCIPVIIPNAIAACLKLHDIKLIGLSAAQVCATFYVKNNADPMFTYKMPCIKLGTDGISMMASKK